MVWVEWLLFSSRLLVAAAETVRIRLNHIIQALKKRLTPWWTAIREPVVQIAASVGVLLSGVVASVGLLVVGVFGVVDRTFAIVGLGGMRRKLFRSLGLYQVATGLDKVLAPLGGLFQEQPTAQEPTQVVANELARSAKKGERGDSKNGESADSGRIPVVGSLPIVGSLASGTL